MALWAQLLADIETAIRGATDLEPAPLPFTISNIPETLTGRVFSVTLQSGNTGKERDRLTIRAAHVVTVELLHSYAMAGGRQEAEIDALDKEMQIIDALLQQASFPAYRILWRSSSRARTHTLTHLVSTIVFDAEHSFTITADD